MDIPIIWANYNISLTWINQGHLGDDSPNPNHDFQGSGEQWGHDEIYPDDISPKNYHDIMIYDISWYT